MIGVDLHFVIVARRNPIYIPITQSKAKVVLHQQKRGVDGIYVSDGTTNYTAPFLHCAELWQSL